MSRARLLTVIGVLIVGTIIASIWARRLFERQEKYIDSYGPDHQGPPTPRTPSRNDGPPPTRSLHAADIVVRVERARRPGDAPDGTGANGGPGAAGETVMFIRGNGEFVRLPRPGEAGPVVTGVAARAVVDAAIAASDAPNAESRPADATWVLSTTTYAVARRVRAVDADVATLLAMGGTNLKTNAVPAFVRVTTRLRSATESRPESRPAWPFRLAMPDRCVGGCVVAESDHDRMKAALDVAQPGAVFMKGQDAFEVVAVEPVAAKETPGPKK